MGTLVGWELKKILNRKALWVALALGLALMVQTDTSVVHDGVSGYARGWHDTYAKYEGQVATEALRTRMQEDYEQYAAAHPESFQKAEFADETGEPAYYATDSGYYSGVDSAYIWLAQEYTVEYIQENYRNAAQELQSGVDGKGAPLEYYSIRFDREIVRNGVWTPVIHDSLLWTQYFYQFGSGLPGMLALAVAVLALLGLFNGEASARMEAVVLTVKARQRLAAAKLIAGAIVVAAVMALILLLHGGLYVWAYGFTGADVPARIVFSAMDITDLTALSMGVLLILTKALAVAACASAVAWASARFRHPLLSLLAVAAVLGAMMVGAVGQVIPHHYNSPFLVGFGEYAQRLPFPTVIGDNLYDIAHPQAVASLVLFPVAFGVLLCWLAYRAFLRRRKG